MSCRCRFQSGCKQQQRFRSSHGICASCTITRVASRRLLFTHCHFEQAFRTGYLWNKPPHSLKKHFEVFTTGADADDMGLAGDAHDVWRANGAKSRFSDITAGLRFLNSLKHSITITVKHFLLYLELPPPPPSLYSDVFFLFSFFVFCFFLAE